jgi:ParB-like chromosome segregation protein Spo0J
MVKKEFIRLPLSELIPYANNPRFNDDAVEDVLESINQCGALDPIEIDENNVILSGHTRLKAMLRRGDKAADVIRYTGLSEEQKTKYRLLTNKTGEKATWDFSKLADDMNGAHIFRNL